ncbi:MerR family transcriptional regulator [Bacillus spongiae]|uniref:MerR family transcriptional regulator n=1 Tax=Bacillus spongiae TaxID=2683610 RepID=A0ABU8HI79_9BACI
MTIQQFSHKTGIPPSTLRFYDKKMLLVPESRFENGYRVYSEDQLFEAFMINSLRNADIQIEDIKTFLSATEELKNKLIWKWKDDVKSKISALKIAEKYLGGLTPKENHLHLVRWGEQVNFVWISHTVERKLKPFHEFMVTDRELLTESGYKLGADSFVRIIETKGKKMKGEVGFIVVGEPPKVSDDAVMETMEPTLFASMDCFTGNEFLCFSFIQLIRQYGFIPTGSKIEKYETPQSETFQYLIPVMNSN